MQRKAALLFIAAAVLAPVTASAGPRDQIGLGVHTCAQFLSESRASDDSADDRYFNWAQGFLSGANLFFTAADLVRTDLIPEGHSLSWQRSFIREYCSSNSAKTYSEAVTALFGKLQKAAGSK